MKDEESWHVGNVFVSVKHAEHARENSTEILLTLYQEHASPHIASPWSTSEECHRRAPLSPPFSKGLLRP
jgi:hypothetical protein